MRAASVEEDTLAYIEFSHVVKEYRSGGGSIRALDDVSFSIAQGSLTIILGASGAGKTTALNILGGMDTLTSGTVTVDGHDISSLGRKEQTLYRRSDIGFVFQFYNLVSSLTALENVELASQIRREHFDPGRRWNRSVWDTDSITSPASSLVANSSGWQSPVP
jgi:putative ABC transport system ATP-binding protein